MTPDELIAHDNTPGWFDPSTWHMLIESTTALPVLIKQPRDYKADDVFAAMQFTYLNTSSVDMDIARVSTFYWDAVATRTLLKIENVGAFKLGPNATFTLDRMVSRAELEAAL